jgi:hypothetical protein
VSAAHRDATASSTTAAGAPDSEQGGDSVLAVTTDAAQAGATHDEVSAAAAAAALAQATDAPMLLSAASKWATPTAAQLQGTVPRAPMPPPKPPPPNVVQSQLQWCQVQCNPEQGCALGWVVGGLSAASQGSAPERDYLSRVCALLREGEVCEP